MNVIYFENQFIARSDINKAIEAFNEIKKGEGSRELRFEAKEKIHNIDILFAGYLLLFKSEMPDLEITLSFPNYIEKRAEFKLRQFGLYGYLLTGKSIFTAEFPNGSVSFDRSDHTVFDKTEFVLSDSFMLLLLVEKENSSLFHKLFEGRLSEMAVQPLSDGVPGAPWQERNGKLFKSYSKAIRRKASPQNKEQCIVDLGRLAFYKCLHDARILPFYADKEYREEKVPKRDNIHVSALSLQSTVYGFYERIEPIFNELADKPLIYPFVLSSLLASDLIPKDLDNSNIWATADKIWDLWRFTENLVRSLTELARNLRDHTTTKRGVITGSVISSLDKNSDPRALLNQLFHREGRLPPEACLDIHVIDLGNEGIIPTFSEASKKIVKEFSDNETIRKLIQEDIDQFNDRSFKLGHLFQSGGVIKLNQQSKRAIAHIGLLTLSRLIEKNNGILKVDTQDQDHRRETILVNHSIQSAESEIKHGTYFTIILPLEKEITYRSHLPGILRHPFESSSDELRGIENLLDFVHIDTSDMTDIDKHSGKMILTHRYPPKTVLTREDEHALWMDLQNKLGLISGLDNRPGIIVHWDMTAVELNDSSLLRLTGYWETYYPKLTLLISNIPNSLYQDLVRTNIALTENSPGIGFWNEHTPIIIYSYGKEKDNRFYFTDLFFGRTSREFYLLNRAVHRNHFNSTSLLNTIDAGIIDNDHVFLDKKVTGTAFFNGTVLLPFDVVLTGSENATMFENNASMLLKNEINIHRAPADNGDIMSLIKSFSGYKVRDSHYRIGSKLHISDFYYAKRIFQNNFFASRFAFILTREIISLLKEMNPEELDRIKRNGISLIGYGLYSELLLSLVEKFLKSCDLLRKERINHDLVSDETDMVRVRSIKLFPNVIIIVPIASTFSTAIKIEEKLRENPSIQVLSPHYNLLHVSDNSYTTTPSEIEREFGWMEKDPTNKKIKLRAFFERTEDIRIQRYFISLPTRWEKIENCVNCFPTDANGKEDLLKEKPLFETDRTSVTPTIIFDLPKGRIFDSVLDEERKYILTAEMIRYGHYAPSNSHLIYSIDTEKFLGKNIEGARKWLLQIKESKDFIDEFPIYEHTVILSSCHHANVSFVNLINEELFNSSANVIHYNPESDHKQNFSHIHGGEITNADRIIFIDDTLKSGKTFDRIHEFVQHIRTKAGGISDCFILIDKSEQFTHQMIKSKLIRKGRIYGFAGLNLYTSLSLSNTNTMALEKERYGRLIEDSFLDSQKVYFFNQIKKMNDTSNNEVSEPTQERREQRHLLMIQATHLIYQYFLKTRLIFDEQLDFGTFLTDLRQIMKNPVIAKEEEKSILDLFPLEVTILKALTQYPFTQYEPVRKCMFRWINQLLDKHIGRVLNEIGDDNFSIESFHGLKFLIRRATLMNSNYLISQKVFLFLQYLYGPTGIPDLKRETEKKAKERKDDGGIFNAGPNSDLNAIETFPIYICAQIKELLSRNPFRSIKLEPLLKSFSSDEARPEFKQMMHVLRVENAIIIQKFYEWLSQDPRWKNLYASRDSNHSSKDIDLIKDLMRNATVTRHQYIRSLEEFMPAAGQNEPLKNDALLNYLRIRNYLNIDPEDKLMSTTDRAHNLFAALRLIFESAQVSKTGIFKTGIFLAIPNGEKDSDLVYDKNSQGLAEIDSSTWPGEENIYLQRFLEGIQPNSADYISALIELRKDESLGKWKDIHYNSSKEFIIKDLHYDLFSKDINGLMLMRLSKRIDQRTEKILGVIGIYFETQANVLADLNSVRYLLLLRDPLADFVGRHYHNNEFRDWLHSENTKRLALLSGHGKEMLRGLMSKTDEIYKQIAMNLEHLQTIILLHDNIKGDPELDDIAKTFDKFYNVSGSILINDEYFKRLKNMADEIYSFEEIETQVTCSVRKKVDPGFSFAFNRQILNLICFEIFVNAKKNRWHFLHGDDYIAGEYNENFLTIDAKVIKEQGVDKMQLSVTNIGPAVDDNIIRKLNSGSQNVKPNDITAGTSLLKTLIVRTLKGGIGFATKPICDTTGLQAFTVTITLNEMK